LQVALDLVSPGLIDRPSGAGLPTPSAARSYIDLTPHDQLIHRDVAKAINGLREFLRLERKRVRGKILSEADRLECLFFEGFDQFDPHFEDDEPPKPVAGRLLAATSVAICAIRFLC
jgi:hypothetical protein